MKRVLTVGVYDYFHYGHLKLFEQARKYGDYLIVAVQADEYILKYKPNAKPLYSTAQRVELLSALKIIDEVILYEDVDRIVKETEFDVFAVGEDQNHSGFVAAKEYCINRGITVVTLKRTPNISSTQIKSELCK